MYTTLLVHLVSGDRADGFEEGGHSSCRYFHGVVDLVSSTRVPCLVLKGSDQLKSSMAMTSTLGRLSLVAHARRLPAYHEQQHVDSGRATATTARRRLVLVAIAAVRWFKNLDVFFLLCLECCVLLLNL
jgi:hypothetical protein